MYCHARDRGTEVEVGVTPDAGGEVASLVSVTEKFAELMH